MTTTIRTSPITVDPREGLLPGALNRTVLAAAVTFALDSMRAGHTQPDHLGEPFLVPGWVLLEGVPAPLTWRQQTWQTAVRNGTGCGTGCCIAGWIDIAGTTFLQNSPVNQTGDVAARAIYLLTGGAGWEYASEEESCADWTLPEGVDYGDVGDALAALFDGDNELPQIVRYADSLLELYGQPPLEIDPSGTFS